MEGDDRGVVEILFQHMSGTTDENDENRRPKRDSDRAPPEHKSWLTMWA